MNHAEKCPVCYGKGEVSEASQYPYLTSGTSIVTCHGCGGKGWVTVEDNIEPIATFVTN